MAGNIHDIKERFFACPNCVTCCFRNAGFDDRLSELRKSLEEKQKSHTDLEETLTQIARESVTNVKNNNE